jgi:glutamate synthase domain-containing protein 3
VSHSISCQGKTARQINQELREAAAAGHKKIRLLEPDARHNLAVALLEPVHVIVEGSVGYYCAGMMDGGQVEIHGSAGWGTAESMLNGAVVIDGSAGSGVAASIRGGTVVVRGDAAARAGVSMKGGTLIIGGHCGYMAGFMMQKGRIIICGNAGAALGDSMYEGTIFVGGSIEELGNDAVVEQPTGKDLREITAFLGSYGIATPAVFRKVVSGKKLWNFDRKDLEVWKAAL